MSEEYLLAGLLGQPRERADAAGVEPGSADAKSDDAPHGTKRVTGLWWTIVAGLAAAAAWVFASATIIEKSFSAGLIGATWSAAHIDIFANVVVFGGLLAISVTMLRLQPGTRSEPKLSPLAAIPLGLLVGVGGLSLGLLHAWIEHGVVTAPAGHAKGLGLLLVGSLMTLFEAFVEELFFRGWLQNRLAVLRGGSVAVAFSALAFAALHVFGGNPTALALVNIYLAGLLFGLLGLRTGAIWISVCAHFGWNWAEAALFGLAPNPGVPSFGSILDLDLVGPPIWGGSAEGLNGSIAVTAILAALILPVLAGGARAQRA